MMLGDFLEISVHCEDVLASLTFYERLGFTSLPTNDIWSHRYGVVSDGRCFIGLHSFSFPSPALTFAAPNLRKRVEELESAGAAFEFLKLGEDEFHELGFLAPDEQMVTLLEARTFSPPGPDLPRESLAGFFAEYRIPVDDRDAARAQWLRYGFIDGEPLDDLHDTTTVCCTGLNVGLTESRRVKQPTLVFHLRGLDERLATLEARGINATVAATGAARMARLTAPEGTPLLLLELD